MNYQVTKYKNEWGIYCKQSRCYVIFFKTKKQAITRLKTLN